MVINSKCFCGDRLTSVCLDISDVRVCAAHLVPACSAHWRMNPFCLPQLRFVEVSGTAARVFNSASKSSIRRFVITEKAPTRAFSWLKAATTAFTFKTLLRDYAKRALTPQYLNVK